MNKLSKVKEFDRARLERLTELALATAKSNGATAAEVGVNDSSGLSVTVRLGEIETLEYHSDQTLSVTVYKDYRKGSASTSDFSDESVRDTVQAACSIAEFTASDECAGLAEAGLMAKDIPELDLYHPWSISAEQATDIAEACENAAREHDKRINNSEGSTVTTYGGLSVYANTHGFLSGYAGTRHSINCLVIAGQGDSMQRDYWYSNARNPDDLENVTEIGRKAAQRTVRRLNARKIETCQVPVLFSPEMARGLLGHFVGAIRGKALYRKASFLLGAKGKAVFPEFITLTQKPHLKRALGSAPFDSDCVATREWDIVKEGVLQNYILDCYSARKLEMQTTGNAGGVYNLLVNAGDQDQQSLLKQMDRGLLVTEMMGHGVNTVTGDYSRGAVGFWVEGGEIQYPVEEITVAGNLKNMFAGIVAVGNDVDTRGNIRSGSMLVDNMTVAGN